MPDPRQLVGKLVTELPAWLPGQRWFAGKDRPVTSVAPLTTTVLLDGDPMLLHVVVDVRQDDRHEPYQLLIGCRAQLPEQLGHALIGVADGVSCYEASGDAELTKQLLDLIAGDARIGALRFEPEPDAELTVDLRPRLMMAEQSNTSLIYGYEYILKLFRKLTTGINPDLRLHRALHQAGCEHIAQPLGAITGDVAGEASTMGMLQRFLSDAVEGWAMATTSVRDLLAGAEPEAERAGGDFAGEAHRLGHAVAVVHADLRRTLGRFEADDAEFDRTVKAMRERLDATAGLVPELGEHAAALHEAFEEVRKVPRPVHMQFIHGDLHLGQVLRTANGWMLIDFEGEPAAPVAERTALRSPLRDVAGMLRSFDYAAHQFLIGQADDEQLAGRALDWALRNRAAFCDGYAEAADESIGDPRAHPELLRAFELDKAVYEVGYELANRPDWITVPLLSIARIAAGGA